MCTTTDVRRGHSSIYQRVFIHFTAVRGACTYIINKCINTHFFFFTDFPLNACFHCFQHIQHGGTHARVYICIILLYSLAGTVLIDYPHASLNGGEKAKKNSTGYGYCRSDGVLYSDGDCALLPPPLRVGEMARKRRVYPTSHKLQRSPGRATDRKSEIIMARSERRRRQHPQADRRLLQPRAWRANVN